MWARKVFNSTRTNDKTVVPACVLPGEKEVSRAAGAPAPRMRRAYRLDVAHFMTTLGIATAAELRRADHKAVIAS